MKNQDVLQELKTMEEELAALDNIRHSLAKRCYQLREKLGGVSTLSSPQKGLSDEQKAKIVSGHHKTMMKMVNRASGTNPVNMIN